MSRLDKAAFAFRRPAMPQRMPRPCRHPRCPELTRDASGYCEAHRREKWANETRGSARERGYDSRWREVRAMKLKRDPLCEECLYENRTKPAVLVHHVVAIADGGEALDMGNLMSVCRWHHDQLHSGAARG